MSTNIEVTTRFKSIIEILDEQNKHDIYRLKLWTVLELSKSVECIFFLILKTKI